MQSPAAAMEMKLKIVEGKNAGVEIAVAGPQFTVGRAEECQLRPKSEAVSRRHAQFVLEDGRATIADLGSRSGTFVNGKLLTPQTPTEVRHDDVVKIGPLEFLVVIKYGLDRQKRPKVNSLEEAAVRTAQKQNVEDDDVSKWLEPADQESSPGETLDGTTPSGTIISAAELLGQTAADVSPTDETKKPTDGGRPDLAASDMLKNYLRRR